MLLSKQIEAIRLRDEGWTIAAIAEKLGVWPTSVRWMLNRGELLERERERRRDQGMLPTNCGKCGKLDHNSLSCGVARRRRK
jgi:orotate phosphoribosyltransferase-like protein